MNAYETDEVSLCDVLRSVEYHRAVNLYGVVTGKLDPPLLSYEDWAYPMKATAGRVCLVEDLRYGPGHIYYTVKGDTMVAHTDHDERVEGPEAVVWLKDAMVTPDRLTPVLREHTPFSEGDG